MYFSSITFMYFFLPLFMIVYAITRPKHRAKILILGSCFHVFWQNALGLIPLAVTVLLAYIGGILIYNFKDHDRKSKIVLFSSILINVLIFLAFSFRLYNAENAVFDFVGEHAGHRLFTAFGVGIYTLHSISYCVDVYLKRLKPELNFFAVCAYVSFLPVLICGPILRYKDISETIKKPIINSTNLSDGILTLLRGLAEKVILANQLGVFWREITSLSSSEMPLITAWLGMIIFGLWFYYEFQGLCHMAKGFALMLGFEINSNFNLPFVKFSLTDFVKSFNTSLYKWTNDYVYKPLCRNRVIKIFSVVNVFILAFISALWYGFSINFLVWSIFITLFLWLENISQNVLAKLPIILRYISTHLILLFSWSLFSGKTLTSSFSYMKAFFRGGASSENGMSWYFISSSAFIIALCILFATPIFDFLQKKLDNSSVSVVTIIKPAIILALLLLSTAFMYTGSALSLF